MLGGIAWGNMKHRGNTDDMGVYGSCRWGKAQIMTRQYPLICCHHSTFLDNTKLKG